MTPRRRVSEGVSPGCWWVAVAEDRTLWTWGRSDYGQLGDGRAPFVPATVNDWNDWGPRQEP